MTLTPKQALLQYHLAERLKLDIMMLAHQLTTIPTLKKEDKPGAKYMLVTLLDSINADMKAASEMTGCNHFTEASAGLDEVVTLAETNQFGIASDKSGEAMIPVTTAAMEAFEVLAEEGLL